MREVASWSFIPPVVFGSPGIVWENLHLDESQLNILWKVAKSGPTSLYQLSKTIYYLPEQLNYRTTYHEEVWTKNLKEPITYKRPFVFKVVKKLEEKKLVETEKRTSGVRLKLMVSPTVAGFVLYLQNSELESSFSNSMGLDKTEEEKQKIQNRKLVPFVAFWDFIIEQLNNGCKNNVDLNHNNEGKKKCFKALDKTIKDFSGIHRVKFFIKPHEIEFNGYVNIPYSKMLVWKSSIEFISKRDEQVAKLLMNPKLASLVRAYLAYLITTDIERLSGVENEEVLKLLPHLESEKEFAYFRPELKNQGSLFQDGQFKNYITKNIPIEHFFTGLFVKNLLWVETTEEKQKAVTEDSDYKVHLLDK
jgi:hypothetical protein